ncbi:MAG TPA: hypothetical protein VLL97_09835 [Acidobacteriota bacterium]|nr:hypothetical protein [Acidobacteriota bacterium]
MESRRFDIPEWSRIHGDETTIDTGLRLHFSPEDEVYVTFIQRRQQTELASESNPEKSGTVFNALFFSKEDGSLVKRHEWPTMGELAIKDQIAHGSRLFPLPNGGYVGIIYRQLQVLDSSLKVLHSRKLDRLEQRLYRLIVPKCGPYFVLAQVYTRVDTNIEVFDTRSFEIVEQLNMPDLGILDIWEDRLLAVGLREIPGKYRSHRLYFREKRIGEDRWAKIGLEEQPGHSSAGYTNTGAIVVNDTIPGLNRPEYRDRWFIMDNGKKGEPVVYAGRDRPGTSIPARSAPIMAVRMGREDRIRAALDMDNSAISWIDVLDLRTSKRLLRTRTTRFMLEFALSSDGRRLAVLTDKTLELYNVPVPEETKK